MAAPFELVTLDLDGTLLPGDTAFATILRGNGHGALAEESDRRYFAGQVTLEECFWEQWAVVQKLSLADLHRALRHAAWLPKIAEGVAQLKQAGCRVALLTDQPSTVTDFLGRWGLTDAICSPVTVKEGKQVAIDARFDKLGNLRRQLAEWGIPETRVAHVGNGVNDVPVFGAVAGSLAVFAPDAVRAKAKSSLAAPTDLPQIVQQLLA